MNLPFQLRRINRVFTNRLFGAFAWLVPPFAVLDHVGRKSGTRYRTPVIAFPTHGGFVVPLTYGRDVDWLQNMRASGDGYLTRLGRRHRLMAPRVVDGVEASEHLPWLARPLLLLNLPGYVLLDAA